MSTQASPHVSIAFVAGQLDPITSDGLAGDLFVIGGRVGKHIPSADPVTVPGLA